MEIFNNFYFLAAWLLVGESKLISTPENRKIWVEKTVRLECCTDLDYPIIWFYTPVDSTTPREIFNGENIIGPGSNYAVDSTRARCYTLVIGTVASHHAGKYECQDNDGFGEKTSAELTVLENLIKCDNLDSTSCRMEVAVHGNTESTSSNCRRETSSDNTRLEFTCHVCFSTGVSEEETTFDLCLSRNISADVQHNNVDDQVSPSVGKTTGSTVSRVFTMRLSHESSVDLPAEKEKLATAVAINWKDVLVIVLPVILVLSWAAPVVYMLYRKCRYKKLGFCDFENDQCSNENEKPMMSDAANCA